MTSMIYHYLPEDTQKELKIIASAILTPGKGILATDESVKTLGRRFEVVGIENTEEMRRQYRQLLFTAEGLGNAISAVILFHDTLHQKADTDSEDILLVDLLRQQKIIPGIKVDKGVVPMYGTEDECCTQGLDDLGPRCEQYKKLSCHFAKWRCVFKIGSQTPSQLVIQENANLMARFASICQAYRMVPIVEPEVLPDGHHNIFQTQRVTEKVLAAVFKALNDHHVLLEGTILRTNMVTHGQDCKILKASPEEVAEATMLTLQRTVPVAVAGITLLLDGQSEEDATLNLNAITRISGMKPWNLTFSFGRALQMSILHTWGGLSANMFSAQEYLIKIANANRAAAQGKYKKKEGETIHQIHYLL